MNEAKTKNSKKKTKEKKRKSVRKRFQSGFLIDKAK